jgi:fido (protein-threonine AMPylation protein)
MATLATLKLSTAVKPTHMPAVQVRRNKMSRRLWEQMELAEALHLYEAMRTLLREELGVAPSEALQEVHRRLLQNQTIAG